MQSPWSEELLRLAAVVLLGLIAGLIAGALTVSLLVAVSLYLAWHLRQQHRLYNWISAARNSAPPDSNGLWGAIFDQCYRMQRRNRRRKNRLRTIVREFRQSTAAMPDSTVVLDGNNRIIWFNSAAARFLRLRTPSDVGQHILNLIRAPEFVAYFNNGAFDEPIEIDSPASRDIRLSLQVIPYGDDQRLLIGRDVTRLYRLERVRRDFVANASHELRTPLTVITGYLDTLADDDSDSMAQWRRPIQEMNRQATRMRQILEDLLLLSRLDAQPDPATDTAVDVAALVAEICQDSRFVADGEVNVDCSTATTVGVRGNRAELHSAVSNLVQNAVKYSDSDAQVAIHWLRDGEDACLDVVDSGIGIPAEHIPRLTERFYRVDTSRSRSRGGTGLGLAIVRHALQRHDATLEITSQVGEGSRFRCRFPASRLTAARADANTSATCAANDVAG